MKKSHVYTRGGDNGNTSLIGGSRVKKCSLHLEAYGTIDELNSHIGLLSSMIQTDETTNIRILQWIQITLFDIGTHLAMPNIEGNDTPCAIPHNHITRLETHIDAFDTQLPPLSSFILPGGCMAAAQSHVCRTVCRRAERLITALAEEAPICTNLRAFVNRLSDFFFVYARYLNKKSGTDEISWKNDCD